jgi:hypothetical protein
MKSKIFTGLVCLAGLFSLLCIWQGHRADPLPDLSHSVKHRGIQVSSKVYDAEESKKYLNSDLLSRGYQPIQITIQNQTATSFYLEGVDLPQVPTSEITRKISKSSLPRSIGYKVAGLFFWPFAIPGTIDGIKTLHKQGKMSKDFAAKAVKQEIISPFSTLHRVLFVRSSDLKKCAVLSLSDDQGKVEDFKLALS